MTIVFFGDSVTEGSFEIGKPIEPQQVYHKKLEDMWENSDITIINAGVGGNNSAMGYDRIDSDVIACNPDIVVVCFGLNDAPAGLDGLASYGESLQNIFDKLKGIKTIFMTPNMLNTYVHNGTNAEYLEFADKTARIQNEGVMDKYMQIAIEIANKNNIAVCDCYKEWKKLQNYGIDTTVLLSNYINHPTRAMHQLFADMLKAMLVNISK